MTGTVARGGCRTSAGRVRLWGRGRAARGARARGLSEAARARPDARARKATCGRGARRSRASIRRHFDVVNQVYGREKGTACARGSRTARGGGPSARLRAETRAAAVATAARCATTGSPDAAPGARVPRAPPAPRAEKGGKARFDGTRTGGSLMSRRVPSPFETRASGRRARSLLRSRKRARTLLSGSDRVCSRARCVTHARATALVFPLPRTPDLRGPAFGNIAPDRRFAVAFDAKFDRRSATATVRGFEFPGFERAVVFEPRSDQVRRFSVTIGAFSIRMLSCS